MRPGKYLPVLGAAAAVIALQLALSAADATYYMTQVTMSAYYALVVIGLCLLMGYAGQVSLGHAGFFAIGGYTSAVLTTCNLLAWHDVPVVAAGRALGLVVQRQDLYGATILAVAPWPAFLAALVAAGLIAFLIGLPVLRLKGHYLAMATLGFGLIIYRVVLGARVFGQADGISNVPPFPLTGGLEVNGRAAFRVQNYYIAWAAVLGAMALATNLVHSRVGRALRSIHQNEQAAHSLGVDTYRYKLATFVLSALLAAAGGILLAHYNGSIGPSEATVMKSVRYVAIVAIGGMANLWGALLMGAALNFLSLRGVFGTYDDAVFGAILIAMMLLAPQGLLHRENFRAVWALLTRGRNRKPLSIVHCPLPIAGGARGDGAIAADPALTGGRALAAASDNGKWKMENGQSPARLPSGAAGPFLVITGVSRSFGGLQAVSDVSFQVPRGLIKAVIGPNGAGKTTLFNLIAGTIAPQAGTVLFQGRAITGWKPHAVASLGIARTFQTTKLFPHMTVLENVMVGRHPRTRCGFLAGMLSLPRTWREDRQIEAKAREILADIGLADLARQTAANLSFGRQRLVEFARALATEPQLLLLDEPAAGLNIYETQELAKLIVKIRDRGVTCLVVEHDMSLVMNISDEVVVLDQGRKIAEGPPRAIQRDPEVIRVYLGDGDA
jgi:branched-chain amino acid transport system permease protein